MRQLEKRGLGSLHFAHVVGFNRFNLEYAAARAGLEAIRVPSQTHIVFRKTGTVANDASLAAKGAEMTRQTLALGTVRSAYYRHHAAKVGLVRGTAAA